MHAGRSKLNCVSLRRIARPAGNPRPAIRQKKLFQGLVRHSRCSENGRSDPGSRVLSTAGIADEVVGYSAARGYASDTLPSKTGRGSTWRHTASRRPPLSRTSRSNHMRRCRGGAATSWRAAERRRRSCCPSHLRRSGAVAEEGRRAARRCYQQRASADLLSFSAPSHASAAHALVRAFMRSCRSDRKRAASSYIEKGITSALTACLRARRSFAAELIRGRAATIAEYRRAPLHALRDPAADAMQVR